MATLPARHDRLPNFLRIDMGFNTPPNPLAALSLALRAFQRTQPSRGEQPLIQRTQKLGGQTPATRESPPTSSDLTPSSTLTNCFSCLLLIVRSLRNNDRI